MINADKLFKSRVEQSRGYNCALFASCGALETEYYIRDGPPDLAGIRHKGYREAVDSL